MQETGCGFPPAVVRATFSVQWPMCSHGVAAERMFWGSLRRGRGRGRGRGEYGGILCNCARKANKESAANKANTTLSRGEASYSYKKSLVGRDCYIQDVALTSHKGGRRWRAPSVGKRPACLHRHTLEPSTYSALQLPPLSARNRLPHP